MIARFGLHSGMTCVDSALRAESLARYTLRLPALSTLRLARLLQRSDLARPTRQVQVAGSFWLAGFEVC